MSGETEQHPSSWTIDSAMVHMQRQLDDLKALLDERQRMQAEAVTAALTAQERSVAKAEVASEKRFECVPVETLVITPTGMTAIGDLRPGDLLADLEGMTEVMSNLRGVDELLTVVTTVGSVRCTRRHPWLARLGDGGYQWIEAGDLTPGWQLWRIDGGQGDVQRLSYGRGPEDEGSEAFVVSVVASGLGEIARLETASHTYLVDGFGAHNSVNEFRGQLDDQVATFITRIESAAHNAEIHTRIDGLSEKVNDMEKRITSRLDLMAGQAAGAVEQAARRRAEVAQGLAIVSLVILAIGLILRFN